MVALEKPLAVLRLNPTSEERQRALDAIDEDESTPLGIDDFCRLAAALRDEISQSSDVSCTCGAVRMQFAAPAVCIGCVECCCSDCHRFLKWAEQQGGPTAPSVPHACYLRADFHVVAGEELLQACVLSAKTDVVRVVLQFLKENSLLRSMQALQEESQVSLNTVDNLDAFIADVQKGHWPAVMEVVATLKLPAAVLSNLYEQLVLELIELRAIEGTSWFDSRDVTERLRCVTSSRRAWEF